ncbi:MAG: hypothetical protein ABFD00_10460 [Chloroherpetonaceae bacterium]
MDWAQFLILFVSIAGMFIWLKQEISLNRTEAAADRRDMLNLMRQIENDAKEFRKTWIEESKDFHGKLERQDAEFKSHLLYHQELNRGK